MTWWWRSSRVPWDLPVGWPSPVPMRLQVVVALLSASAIATYRYRHVWTPLQRRYFTAYVRSGLALTARGSYDLLQLIEKKQARLALDGEVVLVMVGADEPQFALAHDAEQAGARDLAWQEGTYSHKAVHALLRRAIYHDQGLIDLVSPAVWGAFAVFVGGVIGAIAQDVVLSNPARTWRRSAPGVWGVPRSVHVVTVTPERPVGAIDRVATPSRTALPPRTERQAAAPPAASAVTPDPDVVIPEADVPWYHRFFM